VNPWNLPSLESQREELKKKLAMRLLSPEEVDRFLPGFGFEINTDSNRYLEYATPKYNLDRRPLNAANTLFLAQAASFPAPICDPEWPAEFAGAAKEITPEFQRSVFGLDNPGKSSKH